jgi:hypothetical protein
MVWLKKKLQELWFWLTTPYRKYKQRKEFKKRIEEMRKRDPFIYK